jgi:hypothetical protein
MFLSLMVDQKLDRAMSPTEPSAPDRVIAITLAALHPFVSGSVVKK